MAVRGIGGRQLERGRRVTAAGAREPAHATLPIVAQVRFFAAYRRGTDAAQFPGSCSMSIPASRRKCLDHAHRIEFREIRYWR